MATSPDHQAEVDSRRLEPAASSFAETATAKRIRIITTKYIVTFFLIKVIMQKKESVLQRILWIVGFNPKQLLTEPRNRTAVAYITRLYCPQIISNVCKQFHLELPFKRIDNVIANLCLANGQRLDDCRSFKNNFACHALPRYNSPQSSASKSQQPTNITTMTKEIVNKAFICASYSLMYVRQELPHKHRFSYRCYKANPLCFQCRSANW